MAVADFNSRFGSTSAISTALSSIPNPATGQPFTVYDVTDEILQQVLTSIGQWQSFLNYVEMVKGFSVVIRRASLRDIFLTCTQQSDPRITLTLASAKDRNTNRHLFQSESADPTTTLNRVFTFMFGAARPAGQLDSNFSDTTIDGASSYYYSDLFISGIARISAAMTASVLIGRISQVAEQASHAQYIDKQAVEDLNRIIETYSLTAAAITEPNTGATDESLQPNVAFFFRPGVVRIFAEEALVVGYYSLMSRKFREIRYEAFEEDLLLNVGQIASDLADLINSDYTISHTLNKDTSLASSPSNVESPFIATASQSGKTSKGERLVTLSVYPRHMLERVVSQVLNVRIYVDRIVSIRGRRLPPRSSADTLSQIPTQLANISPEAATVLPSIVDPDTQLPIPNELPDASSLPNLVANDLVPSNVPIRTPLPFWGVNADALAQTNYNGVLLTLQADTAKAVSPDKTVKVDDRKPIALYVRQKDGSIRPQAGSVQMRLSPLLNLGSVPPNTTADKAPDSVPDNVVTVDITPNSLGEITQSEVATAIIDGLNLFQQTTRVAGVLFRNDDPYASFDAAEPTAISAIELVCWSIFAQQTYSILDILTLPEAFEIATGDVTTLWEEQKSGVYSNPTAGNYISFHTRWGPAPRSIKVDNQLSAGAEGSVTTANADTPLVAKRRRVIDYKQINEEHIAAQQHWY